MKFKDITIEFETYVDIGDVEHDVTVTYKHYDEELESFDSEGSPEYVEIQSVIIGKGEDILDTDKLTDFFLTKIIESALEHYTEIESYDRL